MRAILSCLNCGTSESSLVQSELGLFCLRCDRHEVARGRYSQEEEQALIDLAIDSGWEDPWQVYLGHREVWRATRGRTLKSATAALKRLLKRRGLEPWRWADPRGSELLDYTRIAVAL